jgi:CubicO group peptidase (beta-lactamase class C family)
MLGAILLTVATALSHPAGLTPEQKEQISKVAAAAVETEHLPGLSVAVLKDGEVWSAAFGLADVEQNVPATTRSLFRIASITKWLTATATLRLAEQGRLDLDAPVQRYCPQFPEKQWRVTTRHLLTHQSGIRHNYGQNGEPRHTDAERSALEALMQHERATQYVRHVDVFSPLSSFKDDALLFMPGTRMQYSSLGYRVLGCVLEGAARIPYRQLMRALVFTPAGMTDITEDDALAIVPHRVAGYSRTAGGALARAPFRDVSENLPAGGYLATATDLVHFAAAFAAARLVSAESRTLMVDRPRVVGGAPAPDFGGPGRYYAMGIMVDSSAQQPVLFHTGGQAGASALLFLFPDAIAVVLLTNIDGSAIREPLARKIGAIAGAGG